MKLFTPIKIKNITFQNRIVMAPIVPYGKSTKNGGCMTKEVMNHYLGRIPNEMGLIISQSLSVHEKQQSDGGVGAYSNEHVSYLKDLVEACHKHEIRFFAQLTYPLHSFHNGGSIDSLTMEELLAIKDDFVNAAHICKSAGCDGIELHGAHGFFLNMLVSPLSNKRKDMFGGDIKGRMKLLKMIVEEIKPLLDDNFILSYRMGCSNDLKTDKKTAQELQKIGIESLHISFGIPTVNHLEKPADYPYSAVVYAGTLIKKQVRIPVTVVNDIHTLSRGNSLLEQDLCDFVAYGRPFLADKNFIINSLTNDEHQPCLNCHICEWFLDGKKCPALKHKVLKKSS